MTTEQAYVDLQSVRTTIDSADAYLSALKFENAVQAYQVAGTQGQSLRTDLPPGALLDQADTLNQQLQALGWHLASQQTAQQAQSLAKQILGLYTQAAGSVTPTPSPTPATPTTPPPSASGSQILLWGAVLLGVGAIGYLMFKGPTARGGALANPLGLFGGRRSRVGRRVIAKGGAVSFEMTDGRVLRASGGMLHDPSGRAWPAHSVLFGPFRPGVGTATDGEFDDDARHYLGKSHRAKVGMVDIGPPHGIPKPISTWTYVGDVEVINYTRQGEHRDDYYHPFNKPTALTTLIKGKGRARLYRRGRYYRLDLPRGAIIDSRGYVWP